LFGDIEVVLLRELVDLVDDLQWKLVALESLDVVALENQVPIRRLSACRLRCAYWYLCHARGIPPLHRRGLPRGVRQDLRNCRARELHRRELAGPPHLPHPRAAQHHPRAAAAGARLGGGPPTP